VIELTTENFASITAKGFAFIVFFAPWCKHCKVLKPVFQELAKQMIDTDRLIFATVFYY
jgi:thiol-disulfide isomerase/thioredoxin